MPNKNIISLTTSNHSGFTLLEVIVALMLIATVGMAIFSWVNNSLANLNRLQEKTTSQAVARSAIAYMQTINPMLQPTGRKKIGGYKIHWQAQSLTPAKMGSGHLGGSSIYELALYDTQVQIWYKEREITVFELRLVGFRQVRQFNFGL